MVNRPFIHPFNIHVLRAGYSPGFVLGAKDTKINMPISSRSNWEGEAGSEMVIRYL